MLRRSIFIAAGIALVPPVPAAAQSAQMHYEVYGPGASSCGAWTAANKGDNSALAPMARNWLLGFITAVDNFYLPSSRGVAPDLLEGTDTAGAFAWVDNYCAAHPLDDIASAAQALTVGLTDKWLAAHPLPSRKR